MDVLLVLLMASARAGMCRPRALGGMVTICGPVCLLARACVCVNKFPNETNQKQNDIKHRFLHLLDFITKIPSYTD